MKPIISPWLIYFASRADNLTTFFGVIAGICSIIAIGAFFAGLTGYDEPFKFRKTISKSIIGCVVMTIITIMTPNTETIYTMAVVNEITPDNIQTIGKTGKDVVDYITDQIDKIVNDKEEDKNNGYLSNSVKRYLQTSTPQYVSERIDEVSLLLDSEKINVKGAGSYGFLRTAGFY